MDSDALAKLYRKPTDFLWVEGDQLNNQAYHALEFIADAARHGLNPNDYHLALLQQLDPELNDSDPHLFDLMLSDGLLKLARDMYIGHLDPAIVDPKWSIPRKPFDAVAFLKHARSTNHFRACLQSLVPDTKQYRQLLKAAERYRTYVENGGWAKIHFQRALHQGDKHPTIPDIRKRLAAEGYAVKETEQADYYDKSLETLIKQFQRQHSLDADGIIGGATVREMNVSAAERLKHIYINLERQRWLPDDLGERYIMVNLANYQLSAIENDEVKLNMRVIVGKTKRPTPSFSSKITHIVLNPRWYVPNKLARIDLLPKQQKNPNYFDRYNIRVYRQENGKRTELNPHSIDWHSVSKQHFPYTLVQDPGNKNALGRLKFILPNPWRIYLHDTPSKSLFKQARRNFSSGCIRVENPLALADFSLSNNTVQEPILDIINSDKNYATRLENPVSVYAIYSTVWLNGDEISFSPDSYHRDKKMANYL